MQSRDGRDIPRRQTRCALRSRHDMTCQASAPKLDGDFSSNVQENHHPRPTHPATLPSPTMAPPRRAIVRRRRRDAEEATEDERGDSQSEASFLSDEDADADASDLSESESVATRNGAPRPPNGQPAAPPASASVGPISDTEAMMNGLKISHDAAAVDFDELPAEPPAPDAPAQDAADSSQPTPAKQETLAERRRREHEEYKKKRDEDPAFIPNRGAFFMHDHRSQGAGSNGFKPYGRGRGRGRGVVGGPYSPAGYVISPLTRSPAWSPCLFSVNICAASWLAKRPQQVLPGRTTCTKRSKAPPTIVPRIRLQTRRQTTRPMTHNCRSLLLPTPRRPRSSRSRQRNWWATPVYGSSFPA